MKELKANKKVGAFKSKEDYVSIHRELLRQDYLIPLKQYLDQMGNNRSTACADYDLASIESLEIPARKLLLKLNVPKLTEQLRNKTSKKRLEEGSLIFLIPADACQSRPLFGLVCFPATELIRGKLYVSVTLLNPDDWTKINLNKKYKFFEYLKHYETHIHPILCLDKPVNDQFDATLVHCINNDQGISCESGSDNAVTINALLKSETNSPEIQIHHAKDLVNHLQEASPINKEDPRQLSMVEFLESSSNAENFKLNDIQLQGIKFVLNNKLSLIQGGPGTGKSFMGKTLVHFFLQNASFWSNSPSKTPIIIMSYTNRALDSFLEDVLPFTQKVIRLGSQFKSSQLEQYSLNEILAVTRNSRHPNFIFVEKDLISQLSDLKAKLQNEIEMLNNSLNILNFSDERYVRKNGILLVPGMKINWKNDEIRKWMNGDTSDEMVIDQPHWEIPISERMPLVFSAQTLFQAGIQEEVANQTKLILSLKRKIEEIQTLESIEVLKKADVIGVTVIGAIKFKKMLEFINNRIVVIEEAGQILESQVLAALPSSCTQLVMIGDHQQLKPITTTYELTKKYSMNVSMFERLINNKIPFVELQEQCRMRSEISNLVSNIFYSNVRDHRSCHTLPDVKGVSSNLLFFSHQERESEDPNAVTSKSNEYEAAFALGIASYLCSFHDPTQITVLSTYTGQFEVLNHLVNVRFPKCRDIKLAVVDNYQGQENDIVILSLVRGGAESIGFLKESNRVCVALTRARLGLFVIGHVDSLTQKSPLWRRVVDHFRGENRLVSKFPLVCPSHKSSKIEMTDVEQFERATKNHWCQEKCAMELLCSHICPEVCHLEDKSHKSRFSCQSPCLKHCSEGHLCLKPCSATCFPCQEQESVRFEPCGHVALAPCASLRLPRTCSVETKIVLPCGHENNGKCGDHERICDAACEIELPCGHLCQRTCHLSTDPQDHTRQCQEPCAMLKKDCQAHHPCEKACFQTCEPCDVPVSIDLPCGHPNSDLVCSTNLDEFDCMSKCNRMLICGHHCRQFCYECRNGCGPCPSARIVHLACGHSEKVSCSQLKSHKCSQPCSRIMPCGHPCPLQCGDICSQAQCQVVVSSSTSLNLKIAACSHSTKTPCYLLNSTTPKFGGDAQTLLPCLEICSEVLDCGHTCLWKCEDCSGGKLHFPCLDRCSRSLICGHICESTCGVKCEAHCAHGQCKKKCSAIDGHLICNEQCQKRMKCGHFCSGFCREECPKECLQCQSGQIQKQVLKNRICNAMDRIFQFNTSASKLKTLAEETVATIDDKEIRANVEKRLKNPKNPWTAIDLTVLVYKLKVLNECPNSEAAFRKETAKKLMKFGACREEFFLRLLDYLHQFNISTDVCLNVQFFSFENGAWLVRKDGETIEVDYSVPK
ncbi:hypothetical protein TCAL_02335, partial [Tigriopus californicus]|eukprot:TCALIF_02335-PA protein Name:"Similar to Znfx1 NFX1-type zinc finger-containing protein 1 (Mus musculus)" AED:0.14 eAED:0.14 QI:74/0.25/0/0.6/0.5/0.2/5/0/1390